MLSSFKPVLAHAFLQQYSLPVPLWLFIYGGAAVVLLSFVVVTFFIGSDQAAVGYPKRLIWKIPSGLAGASALLGVLTLAFTIVAGLFGSQDFTNSISPTLFWILFLLGFTYLTLLAGNIWQFINPFRALLDWTERLTKTEFKPRFVYPEKLGYFPALGFYVIFIWLELLSNGWGVVPSNLSEVLLGYSVLTVIGALTFGKEAWFRYGDFFSVFFRLFGYIAPIQYAGKKVYLRPPFVGLLDETKLSIGLLLFVLFALSSTAFDGLQETAPYARVFNVLSNETLILLLMPLVYLAIYGLFMWLMKVIAKPKQSVRELALKFSLTLLPIAVVYNVAHYFTLVLIQGQSVIRLASDPLGLGWNLFGTNDYVINANIINAATVWYFQVALIVIGHVAAVYLAHLEAVKLFGSTKKAVLSQYPVLALMIIYTVISLWIIAQPIIAE